MERGKKAGVDQPDQSATGNPDPGSPGSGKSRFIIEPLFAVPGAQPEIEAVVEPFVLPLARQKIYVKNRKRVVKNGNLS